MIEPAVTIYDSSQDEVLSYDSFFVKKMTQKKRLTQINGLALKNVIKSIT